MGTTGQGKRQNCSVRQTNTLSLTLALSHLEGFLCNTLTWTLEQCSEYNNALKRKRLGTGTEIVCFILLNSNLCSLYCFFLLCLNLKNTENKRLLSALLTSTPKHYPPLPRACLLQAYKNLNLPGSPMNLLLVCLLLLTGHWAFSVPHSTEVMHLSWSCPCGASQRPSRQASRTPAQPPG